MNRMDMRSRLAREIESWGQEEGGAQHHRPPRPRRSEPRRRADGEDHGHILRPVLYGALALAALAMGKREIPQLKRYLKIEAM